MTEPEFYYEVGEKVRQKRIQRGMSQSALAKIVGVHRNTIWRMEDGDSPVSLWTFLQVCYALSMPHTMMLPSGSIQTSHMLQQLRGENGIKRKAVQYERDPPLSRDQLLQEYGRKKQL